MKGRLIDTTKLTDGVHYGNGTVNGDSVTFDQDDVLVYDKNGTVYYAKGYLHEDRYYYTATTTKPISEYGQ